MKAHNLREDILYILSSILSIDVSLDVKLAYFYCEMLIKQIVCNHPVATGRLCCKLFDLSMQQIL